jgi:hypothetical protein
MLQPVKGHQQVTVLVIKYKKDTKSLVIEMRPQFYKSCLNAAVALNDMGLLNCVDSLFT